MTLNVNGGVEGGSKEGERKTYITDELFVTTN